MSEPAASGGQQIARKTAHAIFWNYASYGLGKGLVFLTTAILARLLTPAEFGIVGYATLAIAYLTVLRDLGLGPALIQRREDIDEASNTVFSLNLIMGAVLAATTFAIAPLVASYFREPLVTPLLRVLAFNFVINAFGSVHVVRLQRELEFQKKLIPDVGHSIIKGVVSIGLALLGFGVWSLVIGQMAGAITSVALSWIVFPWRPRLSIKPRLARALLGFGVSVIGVDVISVVYDNLDYLIIGRMFGNADLGIYTQAYKLPELLVLSMLWVMTKALFPAYAKMQDDPDALRRGFLTTIRLVQIICLPISLGLVIAARPIVLVAFGDQWLAAVPIVRVLALFALVSSIGFNVGDVYKAVGRPDILVKLELFTLALLVPTLIFGARFGLIGVAIGHLMVSLVHMIVRLFIATRFVRVTLWEIAAQLVPASLAGGALAALAVPALLLTDGIGAFFQLIIVALAGAMGYLSVLWLVERESVLRVMRVIGLDNLKGRSVRALFARRAPSSGDLE